MPLSEIKAQEKAIGILKASVSEARVAHAYLFLGPNGVGKHSAAIEFAKLLNCASREADNCGKCISCSKIEKAIHPDIFIISTEEGQRIIPIDKIRELSARLSLKPFEARYKIAVIDAQSLNEEASNALLKILEEPGADMLFILIAADANTLLDTIVSRCQVVRFRPLSRLDVMGILKMDFDIDEKEAGFLADLSGLNIKKALSLRGQDALAWKNAIIDEFSSDMPLLPSGNNSIIDLARDMQQDAMDILLCFYRDVFVYKYTKDSSMIMNIDRREIILEFARKKDVANLKSAIDYIEEAKVSLEANVNSKLALKLLQEKLVV
jgi:DNA polymerase-3 subunit delta'